MDSSQAVTQQRRKLAFTYDEVASAAGISPALVRKLVASGKLERIKIGRCSRIPLHAVLCLCGALKSGEGAK
jgi:excisionase family DNA binding protein